MNGVKKERGMIIVGLALVLFWASIASAQTYSSGSTGGDGPFSPTGNTTLTLPPNGILNFTTVNIPAGVTVTFTRNSANTPVTILATSDVVVAGTLSVNGAAGVNGSASGPIVNPGGLGGPGGFDGGQGGARATTNNNGSDGQGPGGGAGGATGFPGTYGSSSSFVSLIPLFGGSGGGGGLGFTSSSGASGGGGGGAIAIASSSKITINGSITANGLTGGGCGGFNPAGGGSGGAIRLVAPQIAGAGLLQAAGLSCGGGPGRIRLEAFSPNFLGTSTPAASISTAPGPVTSAGNPALGNSPTLSISSVAAVTSPAVPAGSYTTADVSLPQGTTNPVTVTLTATNTPVGTVFTVKLIPQFAAATTVNSAPSTGTFSSSTTTVNLTLPVGQVSVLNASANFTLP